MPPTDNGPTAEPTISPDGKKPSFPKRLLDRFKSRESSSAARSRESPTAPDVKPSVFKCLSGASTSAKSGIAMSPLTTRSVQDVAGASSAPMVPEGTANAQVATTLGPTLVMDDDQRSYTSPVPDDVVSGNNSGKYLSLSAVDVQSH
ncbi:hypothetical protein H0H87_009010 [Tephrocybe sp. NHM501043]|nr:hypothetical protein H0H87_009010 [Tephrocybe sp. NHM501043]